MPGLLQSVAYNEAHGTPNVHLYEVGSLFHGRENASLPKETKSVAGVLSGQWSEQSWNMKYRKLRFFFGKGIVEELLAQLRIEKVRFRPVEGEGYASCSRVVRRGSVRRHRAGLGRRDSPRGARGLRHRRGCRCL
jgi:phenylalanyl-tRNA synthetase beta subunit (EC 6.1.1.20)